MTELEKCMAGQYYDCHDEVFLTKKSTARRLLKEYHALSYEQKEEKNRAVKTTVWRHWDECVSGTAFFVRLWMQYLSGE